MFIKTDWIKNNASSILTYFGAAGTVVTVFLAVKATPKAMDKIQTAQIDKGEDILAGRRKGEVVKTENGFMLPKLTALETIQVCWKDYILPVSTGIGTLACIFGANALSRRQQAAMASAYAALASAFEGYRQKVDDICGSGTDAMIEKTIERKKKDEEDDRPPWDEGQTFYLGCCEKPAFFERTMEEVLRAEYNLNHNFVTRGFATLNELFDFLGLESTKDGELSGWGSCVGEPNCGYKWIEFDHSYYIADSGMLVCSINPLIEPHPLELPF